MYPFPSLAQAAPKTLMAWNVEPFSLEGEKQTSVVHLFPPQEGLAMPSAPKVMSSFRQRLAQELESETQALIKNCQVEETGKVGDLSRAFLLSTTEGLALEDYQAVAHHLMLIENLQREPHSLEEIQQYLNWSLKLTLLQLRGKSLALEVKVKAFCEKILQRETYQLVKRSSEESNNPSYFLKDKESQQPFALLKLPKKEVFSSFGLELPEIPALLAPVWQHDMMAFEQDELFGFDVIPSTLAVEMDMEGIKQRGVIQQFIPQAQASNEFCYQKGGAEMLKSLPALAAHRLALASLFLGFGAGHGANYVLEKNNEQLIRGYLIDGKETFIPFNRASAKRQVTRVEEIRKEVDVLQNELKSLSSLEQTGLYKEKEERIAKLQAQIEIVYKSIIVQRLFILGLPQNKQPLDRATLILLTHPSFLIQLKSYQNRAKGHYQISEQAFQSQMERVQIMQELCKKELKEKELSLSVRDLFFAICGGEDLYKLAKQKGYPDLVLFAHLISDPYHYAQKDFADRDSIPVCTLLEKPRSQNPEQLYYLENVRKLEGLPTLKERPTEAQLS